MSELITPPLTPAQIRELVGKMPRVRLTPLPTPLQECPRLSDSLGGRVQIFMKRDDLTGLAFGGNKTRNLEFRMAEARHLGCDVMIAGLEAQSNSARMTTAASNILGMKTILVLRSERDWDWQGNLLVDRILGAEVRFVEARDNAEMEEILREVAKEQRQRGHKPYVMNLARGFALGSALAYTLSTLEILEQMGEMGAKPDWIYLSSGSKGQAGLVLAQRLLGASFKPVGVSARANAKRLEETARIANDAAARLGIAAEFKPEEILNDDSFSAPGYGQPSEAGLEAIRLVARTEGIILDHVYTGKAMAGLIGHLREGRIAPGETVCFIHTGGTPAIFAYKEAFL